MILVSDLLLEYLLTSINANANYIKPVQLAAIGTLTRTYFMQNCYSGHFCVSDCEI